MLLIQTPHLSGSLTCPRLFHPIFWIDRQSVKSWKIMTIKMEAIKCLSRGSVGFHDIAVN